MAGFVGTKGDHRKPSSVGRTMKGKGNITPPPMPSKIRGSMGSAHRTQMGSMSDVQMRRMMGNSGPITG